MSLISSQVSKSGNISGPAAFSMTVMDSIGHALNSDAQSVLDGLVENYLGPGNLQLQSSLTVVSPGITASGTPGGNPNPNPASDFGTWIEDNAIYIAAAVAGVVLLNNLTGKRR
jgi:hypothetical protein